VTALPRVACAHCGLPARPTSDDEPAFCCRGCATAWSLLHDAGLGDYYRLREALPEGPAEVTPDRPPEAEIVAALRDGELRIALDGMHCASCAWVVEELARPTGPLRVEPGLATAVLQVGDDPAGRLDDLARRLRPAGYGVRPVPWSGADLGDDASRRWELLRLGVAAACAMNVMLLAGSLYAGDRWGMEPELRALFRGLSLALSVPIVAFSALPILRRAAASIRARALHVDVPVAIAILWMFGTSAWEVLVGGGPIWLDSLAMLVFLLLGGRALEASVRRRVSERLTGLLERQAARARRMLGDTVERVAADSVAVGDRLELLPGDVVPLDVAVIAGRSAVDRAVVDGESRPRVAEAGDELPAGARVLDGRLEGRVVRGAARSTTEALRTQVRETLARRAPVELLSDRVARWFTAAILIIGPATWAGRTALGLPGAEEAAVAVLVAACPCALALAVPLAFAAAVHAAAGRGLLVRSGEAMLRLADVDHVAFDKTGTLTDPMPDLGPWNLRDGWTEEDVLRAGATAARGSLHPVSRAVVAAARAADVAATVAEEIRERAGIGVDALVAGRRVELGRPGATVRVDGVVVGHAAWVDRVRPGAAEAVAALEADGAGVSLLSGDRSGRVHALAAQLGIREARGDASPEDKAAALRAMRRAGRTPAFVGDGLNDAAALAEAEVGVAVGRGVDLAVEAADAVLLHDAVPSAPLTAIRLGRRLRATLRRNVAISVTYNVLAVSAAAAGLIGPLEAAALMPLSSLLVLGHAARLARPEET